MVRTIIVDDMPKARRLLQTLLERIEEIEVVADFGDAITALEFLHNESVDLVFLDVEMPGLNGIEAAKQMNELQEAPDVIFLTAYSEYSLEAWKTDAISYLVKPFVMEEIKGAVNKYMKIHHMKKRNKVEIMCFPVFNVFINETPVYFKNKKSKEIMAYLVHNKGGWVHNADICADVFEEVEDEKAKNNLRTYVSRLKNTLEKVGIEGVIEQSYGKIRIRADKVECDYYKYLEGEHQLFTGEYLKEYYWGETTLAFMQMQMQVPDENAK